MSKKEYPDFDAIIAKLNLIFPSRNDVLASYQESVDSENPKWGKTLNLVSELATLQATRNPFYLTISDLEKIRSWKLRGQIGRARKFYAQNTEDNIQTITRAAFNVKHDDFEHETSLRLKLLTAIAGVEIPVASAILTLCYPEKYAIIDRRNWKRLIDSDEDKTSYTVSQYLFYLRIIQQAAVSYNVTTQKLDIAIWALG